MRGIGKQCTALICAAVLSIVGINPITGNVSKVNASEIEVSTETDAIAIESENTEVVSGVTVDDIKVSADVSEAMPAQDFESESKSGIKVKAYAKEGIFPANTVMKVTDVSAVDTEELTDKLDTAVENAVAVDISFYNEAGEEIEPLNGQNVEVEIKLPSEKEIDGEDFEVLHYNESKDVLEEVTNADVNGEEASFKSGAFSIYVITSIGDFDKDKITNKVWGVDPQFNAEVSEWEKKTPYMLRKGESVDIYKYVPSSDTTTVFSLDSLEDKIEIETQSRELTNYDLDNDGNPESVYKVKATIKALEYTDSDKDSGGTIIYKGKPVYVGTGADQETLWVAVLPKLDKDSNAIKWSHSDIEIADGVEKTFVDATIFGDGTMEKVTRTYEMRVAGIDKSTVYDKDNNVLGVYLDHMYEFLDGNGSQYEFTSMFYSIWGAHPDVVYVDPEKVDHVVFKVDIALLPKTQVTETYKLDSSNNYVLDSSSGTVNIEDYPETVVPDQIIECDNQMVRDANNTCPTHSGMDFSVNSKYLSEVNLAYTEAEIRVNKTLKHETIKDGQFEFVLTDEKGRVVQDVKNNGDGDVVFNKMQYIDYDAYGNATIHPSTKLRYSAPGTYVYYIEEKLPAGTTVVDKIRAKKDHYIYDTHKTKVTVTVEKVKNNDRFSYELKASVKYEYAGEGDTSLNPDDFVNEYFDYPAREISGIAWFDDNADGVFKAGDNDKVLPDVTATLYKYNETTKSYEPVEGKSVKTAADGSYKFTDLPEGKFKVVFDNEEATVTKKATTAAADNSIASNTKLGSKLVAETDEIKLPSDKEIIDSTIVPVDGVKTYKVENQNTGYIRVIDRTVEGVVWNDTNKDGKIDTDEKRFPGVTVTLIDTDDKEIDKTTTAKDGSYKFTDVPAGDYIIVVDKDLDVTVKDNDNLADGKKKADGKRYAIISVISLPDDSYIITNADSDDHISYNKYYYTFTLKDQNAGFVSDPVDTSSSSNSSNIVKTGDNTAVELFTVILMMSLLGAMLLMANRKKE